jgi:enoyl-CoA hydratase/carnithine racemase
MTQAYSTLRVAPGDDGVLGVVIDAPPMNLIGPELVRDLVSLFGELESGQGTRVVVLESADPEYFVPHVDLTKVAEYTAEAAKAGGPDDASLGMLWHKLSELPAVSIAKIRGRARGAGSELALACDMRFAARENAIFGQLEAGVGATPGAGAVQHLARLLGRGRAMEAILGADDFDADVAERYGWINRALPDADLDGFVARLARRIASFPADAVLTAKRVLNELTMPGADAIRADARRFRRLVVSDAAQDRTAAPFAQGLEAVPVVAGGPFQAEPSGEGLFQMLGDDRGDVLVVTERVRGPPFAVGGRFSDVGDLEVDVQLHVPVARGVLQPVRHREIRFVSLAGLPAMHPGVVGAGAGVPSLALEVAEPGIDGLPDHLVDLGDQGGPVRVALLVAGLTGQAGVLAEGGIQVIRLALDGLARLEAERPGAGAPPASRQLSPGLASLDVVAGRVLGRAAIDLFPDVVKVIALAQHRDNRQGLIHRQRARRDCPCSSHGAWVWRSNRP